jgi:hypothetical protein
VGSREPLPLEREPPVPRAVPPVRGTFFLSRFSYPGYFFFFFSDGASRSSAR